MAAMRSIQSGGLAGTTDTSDPTFRNYTPQQAASYAAHRGSYSSEIYEKIISYHASHGGQFATVLDVGCGTGGATRNLAPYFTHAIGCDPGQEMIAQATQLGGETREGDKILFEVRAAEELEKSGLVKPASVDLLAAAMAAHWFNMNDFWLQAARIVKPGGTVALWTKSSLYCHPSTINAQAVQMALSHLEDDILGPYELPENNLSRTMYTNLKMPWSVDPPVAAFPQSLCLRCEWNRDGKLEPDCDDFFGGSSTVSLAELGKSLGTASMVTRWRQHREELAGTDADCVAKTMRAVAEAMSLPPGESGGAKIRVGCATTLLLFTRDGQGG